MFLFLVEMDISMIQKESHTDEKIDFLLKIRESNDVKLKDYAEKFGCEFHPGEKPWGLKVDMAFPCATQNEIGEEEAKQLIANGCKYIIEGANMPSTPEAIAYFYSKRWYFRTCKSC